MQLHDKAGVLSITVGIEPSAASGRTPESEIVLKNERDTCGTHEGTPRYLEDGPV